MSLNCIKSQNVAFQAAVQFTANQTDDLMHLRRVYHAKMAQLDRQRRDILEQMSNAELELMRQDIRNKQLEELMGALRQNSMAVYRTHLQYVAVIYDGVRYLYMLSVQFVWNCCLYLEAASAVLKYV